MLLEVWSDVACPFCLIGKRSLEDALASFPHSDEVEVRWRSFELAPQMPATVPDDVDMYDVLARKYGMTREQAIERSADVERMAAQAGVEIDTSRVRPANTHDAHRLLQHAIALGRGDAMKDRLLRAYFQEGATVSDHATLAALAADVGLDAAGVTGVLASDAFAAEVLADRETAEGFGLQGVPAFVLDRRFGLTGAQPPEVLVQGLERAWALAQEDATPVDDAPAGSA